MKYNFKCCLIICLLLVIGWCSLGNPIRENLDDGNNLNTNFDRYRNGYDARYDNELLFNSSQNPNSTGATDSLVTDENRDLYMLKSSTIPPVCTNSPYNNQINKSQNTDGTGKPCQPCPPCGRCPEPAFECKKVPNYNSSNNSALPRPLLNDFSEF